MCAWKSRKCTIFLVSLKYVFILAPDIWGTATICHNGPEGNVSLCDKIESMQHEEMCTSFNDVNDVKFNLS